MSGDIPSPSRWPALLLLAAAIFGPPSAAVFTFTHAVTQNPWLTALLIGIYEIFVFLITLLSKIWQKLEDPWVEQIAGWITQRVQWTISGAYRTYYQGLWYQHRDVDVKGLSTQNVYTLALSQVFVNLNMVPTPAHQVSTDPLRVPKSLSEGEHPIWDYLTSSELANQHFAILGAPGSGKTTLLKHMVLALLHRHKEARLYKIPRKLPILLFLREHATQIKVDKNFSLEIAVHDHIQKWCKQTLPDGWIKQRLTNGKFLVFLDGLDEVADLETRKQVVEWVQQQMIAHGKNRFIVTSRPGGYNSNPLSGVTVLEVHSFSSKQIEQFVHKWYLANEIMSSQKNDAGVRMRATQGAEDLLRRLHHTPALFALAVNPLLLTMIATVHRYRDTLPGKRVTLYAEICEVFLGKRQEAKGLTLELTAAQQRQVLQPLAYHMMCAGVRELPLASASHVIKEPLSQVSATLQPETFLSLVENASGLLLEREAGSYSFAHLTFQEYLAAVHIKETGLEQDLVTQIAESWWHETIRLYCAQADATALLEACLTQEQSSLTVLTLAFECLEEALRVQLSVRSRLENIIEQGVEDADPKRRSLIAEMKLALRLKRMVHLSEKVDIDTSFVTCAEYQLFRNNVQASGTSFRPIHWEEDRFPAGEGNVPLLGVRSIDAQAFCEWLTMYSQGPWVYHLPPKDNQGFIQKGDNVASSFTGGMAYWSEEEGQIAWIGETSSVVEEIKSAIRDCLPSVLEYDFGRLRGFIRDHPFVLPTMLSLSFCGIILHSLDLAGIDAHRFDEEVAHAFANDLNHAYERILLLAQKYPGLFDCALEVVLKPSNPSALLFYKAYVSYASYDIIYEKGYGAGNVAWKANQLVSHTALPLSELFEKNFLILPFRSTTISSMQYAIGFANTLNLDQGCTFDLINLCDFIRHNQLKTLDMDAGNNLSQERLVDICRDIRFQMLILAFFVRFLAHSKRSKNMQNSELAIEEFLKIYMVFALLEARINGMLPVWEGILLARTQKEN